MTSILRGLGMALPLLMVRAQAQPCDHVIVTSQAFVSHFAPFGAFIESNLGLQDTAVTVENIYGSFPGRDRPEQIRNFIRCADENCRTSHVLLGGAAADCAAENFVNAANGGGVAVDSRKHRADRAELLDIAGRKVMDLAPGTNDVCRLAPGVHFVFPVSGVRCKASNVFKIATTR